MGQSQGIHPVQNRGHARNIISSRQASVLALTALAAPTTDGLWYVHCVYCGCPTTVLYTEIVKKSMSA